MQNKEYAKLEFKRPIESENYRENSAFVLAIISKIINDRILTQNNKIEINTNLKFGIPMENINKLAGPVVEAWVYEVFSDVLEDSQNTYNLINIESCERLGVADVILQFKIENKAEYGITANVDVKATSEDIKNSGKSPNITSFARIRSLYIEDPDYIFIILSLKHKVYSNKNASSSMTEAIMEIVSHNCYDLKYISDGDISYNPALGTGQIQIRDIHYVENIFRNTWEFCQLLDEKFIKSKKGYKEWLKLAKKYKWIKNV